MKNLLRAAVVLTLALLAVSAVAQIKGVPASVTSSGTPGRGMVPASVTSIGPNGLQGPDNCCAFPTPLVPSAMGLRNPFFNTNVSTNGVEQGRSFHLRGGHQQPVLVPYYVPYPYAVPVLPEGYDQAQQEAYAQEQQEEAEPPAPTIFEHRPMVQRRPDPPRPTVEAAAARPDPLPPQPEREQEPTLLVFKDGHKLEIQNFAIVGETVIELSPEYRKIPLAELDVPATVKENDARGVEFHVPGHKGS